ALFGYTKLYGEVPGAQAEYLRVPQAQYGPIKVPDGPPDDRFVYLSDVLPTAYQAVEYADVPAGGTLVVLGLGPIGDMCTRIARQRGGTISVIGVYGGMLDPMPMLTLFDKQIQLRMGQANVRRWVDDLLPLLTD